MRGLASYLLVAAGAGLAQAVGLQYTAESGTKISITMTDKDGAELPVELGPALNWTTQLRQPATTSSSGRKNRRGTISDSANWCGLINQDPPSGQWSNVIGQWVVPEIALRSGQTDADEPSIAEWVGIDGTGTCSTGGLIQAGTLSYINDDGVQETYAWWEYLPEALQSVSMTVSTGDSIITYVQMNSTTSGTCIVENLTTGDSVTIYITDATTEICGASAEWIIEDVESGGLVPFATLADGTTVWPLAISTDSDDVAVLPSDADQSLLIEGDQVVCLADFYGDDGILFVVS